MRETRSRRLPGILCIALAVLFAAFLMGCAVSQDEPQPAQDVDGELVVRFIDVGQGDCALLSCNGHHVLIDGGPREASRKVYSILRDIGIKRLDAIVATHPDGDHIGGLSSAISAADARVCYCSTDKAEEDQRMFSTLLSKLEKAGCPLKVPVPGDTLEFGGAVLTFVGPVGEFEYENDNSLVCRVDFGKTSFLFTGDAEHSAEDALVASGAALKADVLKVAHHGSSWSSTAGFLKAVDPTYAVISVGAGNTYGHPTTRVLDRLAQVGAKVYRTDLDGSVIMKSDGMGIAITTTDYVDE